MIRKVALLLSVALLVVTAVERFRSHRRGSAIRYVNTIFGDGLFYLGVASEGGLLGVELYRSRGLYYAGADDYGVTAIKVVEVSSEGWKRTISGKVP